MSYRNYVLNARDGDLEKKDWVLPRSAFIARGKSGEHFPENFSRDVTSIPTQDQLSIGSCVANAGIIVIRDGTEYQHVDLSRMWIYKKAKEFDEWPGEDYSGTSISGACKAVKTLGMCLEEYWPYEDTEVTSPKPYASTDAANRKIFAYYKIDDSDTELIQSTLMKEAIWTSFDVRNSFYNIGTDGILKTAGYLNSKMLGGHAVALIGWKTIGGKLYWSFQNSWGVDFGDHGIFHVEATLYEKISHGMYYVVTQEDEAKRLRDLNDDKEDPKPEPQPEPDQPKKTVLSIILDLIKKILGRLF